MKRYNPKEIEPKWQQIWDEQQTYKVDLHSDKPKYFAFSMFNYPSGNLHIGHAMNFTISDVKARFKRQLGHESYHPIGWDAFGLPAENRAIKEGMSPQESMSQLIPQYHQSYKAMGWSNDWSKEIATHTPAYYKWTQWIFSQMYKHGLAYQDSRKQWWCEQDKTVLANEQIVDGKCWRHDGPDDPLVEQKEVKQWFFKITEYADELLAATDELDWTESVKLAQKNWIGKSTGAEITFKIADASVTVFTTRADTLYGATFLVLAPEHELVQSITTAEQQQLVDEYIKASQLKSEIERQSSKDKTGVFTGAYAINPATNEHIPVWIADYVLTGYGTGAIMAVPAHDERDSEFASKFNLPIKAVVEPTFGQPTGDDTHKESIFVVLRNPVNDTVLILDWGPRKERHGGNMLIGGGVEGDESYEATAEREIVEETGYKNFKLIKQSDFKGHGYFYSNTKHKNMHVSGVGLLYELIDDEQTETNLDEGEKDKFTVTWQPSSAVAGMLDDGVHEAMYRHLVLNETYHGEGILINSGPYNGKSTSEVRDTIIADLAQSGLATEKTNYKMRDWSVSRQRYWGAPIPIIHCQSCGIVPVPDDQLPVVLPELTDFQPSGDGRSALARATEWLNVSCPNCGGPAERETDTLDTYICSSWYMFRYLDPENSEQVFDPEIVNKWTPVDFYNGGDHATAHMLYARFVTRFFAKIGLLENPEPFKQFLFNGKVTAADGTMFSKSKGNGVDPLEIINQGYGADALRTYLMFAAPLELWAKWDAQGVPGTYRFLNRVWTLVQEYLHAPVGDLDESAQKQLRRSVHSMIKKMSEDIEENRYNTAIAAAMAATNELYKIKTTHLVQHDVWKESLEALIACIAPFAPHTSEELWQQIGHETSVHHDSWPTFVPKYLETDTITMVVQVNGKLRGEIAIDPNAAESEIVEAALALDRVISAIEGREVRKTIHVPTKLINFVV